jgi:hypothetical protein
MAEQSELAKSNLTADFLNWRYVDSKKMPIDWSNLKIFRTDKTLTQAASRGTNY